MYIFFAMLLLALIFNLRNAVARPHEYHLFLTFFICTTLNIFFYFFFVSEGGRLQEELKYVESKLGRGAGSTSELIIQTPRDDGSILTPEALLAHLDVIKAASKVVVEKHDV